MALESKKKIRMKDEKKFRLKRLSAKLGREETNEK